MQTTNICLVIASDLAVSAHSMSSFYFVSDFIAMLLTWNIFNNDNDVSSLLFPQFDDIQLFDIKIVVTNDLNTAENWKNNVLLFLCPLFLILLKAFSIIS